MTQIPRAALYGLLFLNLILALAVINLYVFAGQGKRYTSADGAVERAERIEGDALEREERRAADRELSLRIDGLLPHTCPTSPAP